MATITERSIIERMLENDGIYPGDPQPWAIYEYVHVNGRRMWAVFYNEESFDLDVSPFVWGYRLLWSKEKGKVGELRPEWPLEAYQKLEVEGRFHILETPAGNLLWLPAEEEPGPGSRIRESFVDWSRVCEVFYDLWSRMGLSPQLVMEAVRL